MRSHTFFPSTTSLV